MCNNQLYARRLSNDDVLFNILGAVINQLLQQPDLLKLDTLSQPTVETMPVASLEGILMPESTSCVDSGHGANLDRQAVAAALRVIGRGGNLKADLEDLTLSREPLPNICQRWRKQQTNCSPTYCSATWDVIKEAYEEHINKDHAAATSELETDNTTPSHSDTNVEADLESDWGDNYPDDDINPAKTGVDDLEFSADSRVGSKGEKPVKGTKRSAGSVQGGLGIQAKKAHKGTESCGSKGTRHTEASLFRKFMLIWGAYVALLLARDEASTYVGAVSGAGILLLFGMKDTYTRFHLDQFGALCWGVAVGITKSKPSLIACWLCIHPSKNAVDHVKEVLSIGTKNTLSPCLKRRLTNMFFTDAPVMKDNKECILGGHVVPKTPSIKGISHKELNQFYKCCNPEFVKLVEQYSGQFVRIFPGWMHYVYNIRDNVKASVEVMDVKTDLAHGSWYQHTLGCKYFGAMNAEDYTNYMAVSERKIKSKITNLVNKCLMSPSQHK